MKDIADADKKVNSYNHPMHGGFMYTIFTDVCGIKPSAPGFSKIVFSPCFSSFTDKVEGELKLVSGKFAVNIQKREKGYSCTLNVPAGVTFEIDIPYQIKVNGNGYIKGTELGSGIHEIVVEM
jgi:hypothetical protein